jgi:hypothetical protein
MTGRAHLWIKAGALCALLILIALPAARAFRPYAVKTEAKTSWMTISSPKSGQEYYMEVAADGAVVSRIETKGVIITRRGAIKEQLAKDFFREIESCDIILSQGTMDGKLVFYRGDKLKISAYISGEIRRIDAPLNNFGEAFSYAFNEVKKAAGQLPVEKTIKGFLMAEPLTGIALEEYNAKSSKETGAIETYDIQKTKPLMKAIKQPYRLIPLEGEDDAKEIQAFITVHGLDGLRRLFYLPSTRGTFKCQVLDAAR